jgi:hypothetical protein
MLRSRLTPGTGQRRRSLTAPSFTKKLALLLRRDNHLAVMIASRRPD